MKWFKKKKYSLDCEKCKRKNILVLTEISENNIEYILKNLDFSGFRNKRPFKSMNNEQFEKSMIMFINLGYDLYKCPSCNWIKLTKKKNAVRRLRDSFK